MEFSAIPVIDLQLVIFTKIVFLKACVRIGWEERRATETVLERGD